MKERKMLREKSMAREWDDEMLHNVGVIQDYTDKSPVAYENENTEFVKNDKTW